MSPCNFTLPFVTTSIILPTVYHNGFTDAFFDGSLLSIQQAITVAQVLEKF
jgi:hypothetical protein